ncbi:hypothetical protein EON65_35990 [archaeon]|nr:MAG: hypothetical protein EON65_35990 [archaeon]
MDTCESGSTHDETQVAKQARQRYLAALAILCKECLVCSPYPLRCKVAILLLRFLQEYTTGHHGLTVVKSREGILIPTLAQFTMILAGSSHLNISSSLPSSRY